nr:heparan-alpha-glucosaminide N-acetyltransferase-like [Ipomoea batatas]
MMAIVTCFVGVHFGHVIIHFKDHKTRILQWIIPSCCLLLLGVTCNLFGMRINKVLYSFSYTCVTAGTAGVVFAGVYIMVRYHNLSEKVWRGRVEVIIEIYSSNPIQSITACLLSSFLSLIHRLMCMDVDTLQVCWSGWE